MGSEMCIRDRYITVVINIFLYIPLTDRINLISVSFYIAPFTNLGDIQVWIQAIKVGQDWRFHDGSPLTFAFPTSLTNGSDELHLRCKSDEDFECRDISEDKNFDYKCEYYRQFL